MRREAALTRALPEPLPLPGEAGRRARRLGRRLETWLVAEPRVVRAKRNPPAARRSRRSAWVPFAAGADEHHQVEELDERPLVGRASDAIDDDQPAMVEDGVADVVENVDGFRVACQSWRPAAGRIRLRCTSSKKLRRRPRHGGDPGIGQDVTALFGHSR